MNHLKEIAAKLDEFSLDAMMITSPSGERYAVGFHGEGLVLVTRDAVHYSTDGRYIEAAQAQVTGADIALTRRERSELVLARDFIREHKLEKVGFESESMSVDTYHRYAEALPCLLVPAQELLTQLRGAKDEEELAAMTRAQEITDQTFSAILEFIKPGMTEKEVAARLIYELIRHGGDRISFDPIVAAGPNGSKPHAEPGDTVIREGMFVTMDFGCVYNGYCSDMTRTIAVGQPTDEMVSVYNTVLQAQLAGIAAAKAGIPGREIDAAARQVIIDAGYGQYFTHSLGHSLGLDIHEGPNASPTEQTIMPVGAVISQEPGIYLPGRFGVRIEDVVVLKEDGCGILTRSPKELIIL